MTYFLIFLIIVICIGCWQYFVQFDQKTMEVEKKEKVEMANKKPADPIESESFRKFNDTSDVSITENKDEPKYFMKGNKGAVSITTEKMHRMIENHRELAEVGIRKVALVEVDLNLLLFDVYNDLNKDQKNNGKVLLFLNLPKIIENEDILKVLFTNLILNGWEHNRNEEPTISIVYRRTRAIHIFSIKDNGVGLLQQQLDRALKLSGTGLSISRKIARKLKGDIYIKESVPSFGTTIELVLPIRQGIQNMN